MLKHFRRTAGWLIAASLVPAVWAQGPKTTTPIKYVVVIFQENNSFDHYFGTYPNALYPSGQPVNTQFPAGESAFVPQPNTPSINGITPAISNLNPVAPFRLDRSQALTCDNDNAYTEEQKAYDGGLIDQVSELLSGTGAGCTPNLAMGYYDGNTVTALWNYAQHFAMSDSFFGTNFGVTLMGHLNLVSGQTHGATPASVSGKVVNGSVIANIDPALDDCSTGTTIQMSGANVGDLLNAKGITWGWFYGDWTPTSVTGGKAQCVTEYDAHYTPFQYYASTANPHHLAPSSVRAIGSTDQANHQYALTDFWNAVAIGNIPAVSFLKAPADQTGHPSNSSPLAEQTFLVDTINRLQQSPAWNDMAILIAWDDSDGWYDHVLGPIVNKSSDPSNDALLGSAGLCGTTASGAYQDRCGYGPRLPMLVISPWARHNFVDHTVTDQTSVLRFVEDNWLGGKRLGAGSFDTIANPINNMFNFERPENSGSFILDPSTGTVEGGFGGFGGFDR